MKGKVDEPNGSRKRLSRDEQRKDRPSTPVKLRLGITIFDRNYNFSVQTNKTVNSAPEHASRI